MEYFFRENILFPGEYTVDVTVNYQNQSVSESSSMFIIGSAANSGSTKVPIIPSKS